MRTTTFVLMGLLAVPACSTGTREPLGERIGENGVPSWTVPRHSCEVGTPSTDVDKSGGVSQFCHDGTHLQGNIVKWHSNGQKAAEGTYRKGLQTGPWVWWHPSGQIATRGQYRAGNEDGNWTWWHENGQTQMRGDHLNGQRMGQWQTWYPTGQLMESGYYRNGRLDGTWQAWTPGGELARRTEYDLGRITEEKVLIEPDDERMKTPAP